VKELVEYIARELVDQPDKVQVHESGGRNHVLLELAVGEGDAGKVIGRGGRVAQSIRALVKVSAARQNVRATLDIV
jgi:hypothetical protein